MYADCCRESEHLHIPADFMVADNMQTASYYWDCEFKKCIKSWLRRWPRCLTVKKSCKWNTFFTRRSRREFRPLVHIGAKLIELHWVLNGDSCQFVQNTCRLYHVWLSGITICPNHQFRCGGCHGMGPGWTAVQVSYPKLGCSITGCDGPKEESWYTGRGRR